MIEYVSWTGNGTSSGAKRRRRNGRPGRRESNPHLGVVVPAVPAFGPWDGRVAAPCSVVVELRIPAARGERPYAPDRVDRSCTRRVRRSANQTEGAYRVGSRVSDYSSVTSGRRSAVLRVNHQRPPSKANAPPARWRRRGDGTLPRLIEDGFTRVLVWQSLHQMDVSDANPA